MRRLIYLTIVVLTAMGCAGVTPTHTGDNFAYFDQHCREHARDMAGEADENGRYQECLALHGYSLPVESDTHLTGTH